MNEDQIKAVLARIPIIHQKIDAWLLATPPVTPDDQASKDALSAKQDELIQKYDTATEVLFDLVGKDLSAAAAQIAPLADQIEATATDIANVETVINITAQAVAAVASIVALAA